MPGWLRQCPASAYRVRSPEEATLWRCCLSHDSVKETFLVVLHPRVEPVQALSGVLEAEAPSNHV